MPLVLPLAATAESRSKKSNMMRLRASDSTLRGMKVSKAWRAKLESGLRVSVGPVYVVQGQHTGLAFSEELVGIPGDDTARQSAPAPFHDTAEGLCTFD